MFKTDACILVELTDRPTIRVVSRLYRERTKACLLTNEKSQRHGQTTATPSIHWLSLHVEPSGLVNKDMLLLRNGSAASSGKWNTSFIKNFEGDRGKLTAV